MSDSLINLLAKYGIALPPETLEQLSSELESATQRLADLVGSVNPLVREELTNDLLTWLRQELHRLEVERIKATTEKPSLEIMEWARQEINDEEIEEQIREMRLGGGLQFKDFIEELKLLAHSVDCDPAVLIPASPA
jgi:hypothetical protein